MTRFHPGRRRLLSLALAILVTLGAGRLSAAELRIESGYNQFVFRPLNANENYPLDLTLILLPEEDIAAVTDGQDYGIVRQPWPRRLHLRVECKLATLGVINLGPFSIRVNGQEFKTSTYKVVALPPLPDESGLTIASIPDPNGSGMTAVEIEDCRTSENRKKSGSIELDRDRLPKGVPPPGGHSHTDGHRYSQIFHFKNDTAADFILGPEYFKNLPEGYELPRLVIPPTPKEPTAKSSD